MTGAEYRKLRHVDLRGRVGCTLRQLENRGGVIVPEGTIVTIDGKKRGGLALTLPECATCGLRFRIVGVNPADVELMPVGTPAPGPTTEGRAHWTARGGN